MSAIVMILRKTKLQKSDIQGIGLFADEDISQGTAIDSDDDFSIIKYTLEDWRVLQDNVSNECFKQIKRYAYKDNTDGLYRLNLDDVRFINHSTAPNVEARGSADYALRNIKKGEEITIDYTTFYDRDYFNEIITFV